jgi:hypothetical protein
MIERAAKRFGLTPKPVNPEEKEDSPVSQLTSPVEFYWISGSPFAWRGLLTAEVKGIP